MGPFAWEIRQMKKKEIDQRNLDLANCATDEPGPENMKLRLSCTPHPRLFRCTNRLNHVICRLLSMSTEIHSCFLAIFPPLAGEGEKSPSFAELVCNCCCLHWFYASAATQEDWAAKKFPCFYNQQGCRKVGWTDAIGTLGESFLPS